MPQSKVEYGNHIIRNQISLWGIAHIYAVKILFFVHFFTLSPCKLRVLCVYSAKILPALNSFGKLLSRLKNSGPHFALNYLISSPVRFKKAKRALHLEGK
jgi:hypothetical protein